MLVVATAGHVDHGKSALVHALTGMEPDRWAEERRRGMTIGLGYAWTDEVTLVDVPGHERFVATMLAGVSPVPAALLVVSADGGWSAQTEEHATALRMLRVRHGVVAVTRADLAEPGPVVEDVRRRLDWPVVVTSARTGAGVGELHCALAALAAEVGPSPDSGRPRLWVDRAFSLPGAGPVVTGTLAGGRLRAGDRVTVGSHAARIAGLQTRGREVTVAEPGTRVAVRLRGVVRADLSAGTALVLDGQWREAQVIDARLTERSTRLGDRAHLHIGSADVVVRVRPLGDDHVRLTLPTGLPLQPGDRGLLRDPGSAGLLAGVEVLDVDPPRLERRGAAAARGQELASGLRRTPQPRPEPAPPSPSIDLVRLATAEAALRRLKGPLTIAGTRVALGLDRAAAVRLLETLDQRGRTVRRPDGTRVFIVDNKITS